MRLHTVRGVDPAVQVAVRLLLDLADAYREAEADDVVWDDVEGHAELCGEDAEPVAPRRYTVLGDLTAVGAL